MCITAATDIYTHIADIADIANTALWESAMSPEKSAAGISLLEQRGLYSYIEIYTDIYAVIGRDQRRATVCMNREILEKP